MMSQEPTDKPSRLSGVAVLPWTVALVLLLLLAGLLGLAALGFTSDPYAEPDKSAETAPAETPPAETPQPSPPVVTQPAEPAEPAPAELLPVIPEDEVTPQPEPDAAPDPVVLPEPEPTAAPAEPAPEPTEPSSPLQGGASSGTDTPETTEVTEAEPGPQADAATSEIAAAVPVAPSPETEPGMEPVLPPSPLMIPRGQRGGLRPAPDPGLVESSPLGPLPRIGPDGREPWKVYARPFDATDTRPRVAIILSGLGLSSAATEAAIQDLPGEVTLAFQPFADNIQQWIQLSRAAGHEVLLNLPMEPVDFPANDPGPRALFVTLSPDENQDRMRWALSRVSGYVGVVNHMGSRFTTSRDAMQPILAELKARGLLFVDARSAARSVATVLATEMEVPRAINDRFLDNREVSRATVDARLAEVERIAKEAGVSIAIGQAFPVTLERVRAWAATLEGKGIALVPISAVVDTQSDR